MIIWYEMLMFFILLVMERKNFMLACDGFVFQWNFIVAAVHLKSG